MSKRVLVGMSGGVDSTVTAILLQRGGYSVTGVYMKLHENEAYHKANFSKAKRVAEYLNIPIHFYDLSPEFKSEVYDYFVETYRVGLTPNPCIFCNRTIKFGKMVEFADSLNIEKVATGHYLRCDGEFFYEARDKGKDQSYFVGQVEKGKLPRLIFPLGDWIKDEVKEFAKSIPPLQDIGEQRESSEICFVESDYTEILKRHMEIDMVGETVNSRGEIIGTHKGYMHYTIGKRRGFTVHGAHNPHFVLSIQADKNQIVVGKREELQQTTFSIKQLNLFEDLDEFEATVKVRYRTPAVPCSVKLTGDGGEVQLQSPIFGVAYGQVAVFYDGDRVLGSGVIC